MSNTKVYIHIVLFILLLIPFSLISQNKLDEIKIKRSNDYYWGQAYNADSSLARLSARDDLMFKISNQISNSGTLNSKTDLMVQHIRYIFKSVEELTKVIAYVSKKDVSNIIGNKETLLVNEMKYTETNTTSSIENPIEKAPRPIENKPIEQRTKSIVKIDMPSSSNGTALIDRLIACNTGEELRTLLKNEEYKNTLIFSWDSKVYRKSVSSENFYIALIDPTNNNIIAFLDKNKSERKDLKNNQRIINIEREFQNMKQVWIQLL